MTLRRQLFIAISVLFLAILLGLLTLSVRGTRDYLAQQLGSLGQDTATALSLPLAQSLGRPDLVLAGLQVEAVFDRGYFARITVVDTKGEELVRKELPAKIDQVPLWFTNLFPLDAPPGEAFISSGWRQLGKVLVTSQPAFAYQYLWSTATEIALWMVAVYGVALALTVLLLRIILRPLQAIEDKANEVQQRRFGQISIQPRARELARVVAAMNAMARRISEMLDSAESKAEDFRKQAFVDEVSGLDNRRSFDLRMGGLLGQNKQVAQVAHGMVAVLEVDGLKAFNTGSSYREGNALLAALAESARQVLGREGTVLSRIGGSAFAFVMAGLEAPRGRALAAQLQERFDALLTQQDPAQAVSFALGAVSFQSSESMGQIMSRADLAVEAARQSGRNKLHVLATEGGELDTLGSLGWRELLRNALKEGRWQLLGQPVVSFLDGRLLHSEVMLRLTDQQGHQVPAAKFIPMAMRHHLMPEVDTAVVTLVLQRLQAVAAGVMPMAINISMQSLQSASFMAWLSRELQAMGPRAKELSFEVSRFGCGQDIELARQFATLLRGYGAQFGIDRFGLDPQSLQTLRALPPDYVKLDSLLVGQTSAGEASTQDLVNAIVTLAKSIEVVVIAQGVEQADQAEALKANHDAGQGYFFGAPVAL